MSPAHRGGLAMPRQEAEGSKQPASGTAGKSQIRQKDWRTRSQKV